MFTKNNIVLFFQSYTQKSRNHVHSKPKVGVIPIFVSQSIELRTFIVEQSDSVNSREKKKEKKRDRKKESERKKKTEFEADIL